jgi:LuxR family maltose regulon positive regulatory protein
VRIAEAHGWGKDPIIVTALAAGAMALLWLGRLDEAEPWVERAGRTLYRGGEPGTELIVQYARGLLRLAQERLDEALSAFRAAERMQALMIGEHAFARVVRARLLQTQTRMGRPAAARAALADIGAQERDTSDMRVAEAVVDLAQGEPERVADVLAPAIERVAPTIHGPSVTIEAQLLDAVARECLGDRRAAEASLERALDGPSRRASFCRSSSSGYRRSLNTCRGTAPPTPRSRRRSWTCSPASRRARRRGGRSARGAQRGGAPGRPLPAEQPQGVRDRR